MSDREMEERELDADPDPLEEKGIRLVCPVCGNLLHKNNLVDIRSIVEDNLCYIGGVRIVNSKIELHCDFDHRYREEGFTIDEPHGLVAVIDAVFDGAGRCIQFEITKVCPV